MLSEKFFSRNLLGNASSVAATEVALFFARRTIFIQLVRSISAIIFAIAEEPFGNATVIGMSWTPSPATEKKMFDVKYVISNYLTKQISLVSNGYLVIWEINLPSTIAVSAKVSRLIRVISTIIVKIALP